MAFGDTGHARLLNDGWRWNGVWYEKTTGLLVNDGPKMKSHEEVDMMLSPALNPHSALDVIRRQTWVLKVGTVAICSFKDLMVASHALTDCIKGD